MQSNSTEKPVKQYRIIERKLYPNAAQNAQLETYRKTCARLYNQALEHRIKAYKRRKLASPFDKFFGCDSDERFEFFIGHRAFHFVDSGVNKSKVFLVVGTASNEWHDVVKRSIDARHNRNPGQSTKSFLGIPNICKVSKNEVSAFLYLTANYLPENPVLQAQPRLSYDWLLAVEGVSAMVFGRPDTEAFSVILVLLGNLVLLFRSKGGSPFSRILPFLPEILFFCLFAHALHLITKERRSQSNLFHLQCPWCGKIVKKSLKERIHQCSCRPGVTIDRDHASGLVIEVRSVAVAAASNLWRDLPLPDCQRSSASKLDETGSPVVATQ